MVRFFLRALAAAVGFWLASVLLNAHVHVTGPNHGLAALIVAGVLLGVVNALVRPIITLLTLPLTVVTLGLFLLVVNGISVSLVVWLVHHFRPGGGDIVVPNFWYAILTAIIVAIAGWVGSWFIGAPEREAQRRR